MTKIAAEKGNHLLYLKSVIEELKKGLNKLESDSNKICQKIELSDEKTRLNLEQELEIIQERKNVIQQQIFEMYENAGELRHLIDLVIRPFDDQHEDYCVVSGNESLAEDM